MQTITSDQRILGTNFFSRNKQKIKVAGIKTPNKVQTSTENWGLSNSMMIALWGKNTTIDLLN